MPPTKVEADARGLEGRRGMRETPARARTFDEAPPALVHGGQSRATARVAAADLGRQGAPGAGAVAAPGPFPGTAPETASQTAPQTAFETASEAPPQVLPDRAPAAAVSQQLPASAERLFALQRALARQEGAEWPATPAAGLLAQAGRDVVSPVTTDGAGPGSEGHGSGHRQNWTGNGTQSAATPIAGSVSGASAAVVGATEIAAEAAPGMALAADGAAARFGPAAGAAWRAALASTAFMEALGHDATAAGTPSAPGLSATAVPAFELLALRDRGPLVEGALPPPALDPTTAESVHSQIVKSIRLQWSGGLGEARVTLKPGYLGEVVASIKVEHGVVTATLQSDTPEVRRWMESHTATLREALVEHGLRLDRLTVAEPERPEAQGDRQAKPRQRQPDPHRQRGRRQTADTDTPFDMTTE